MTNQSYSATILVDQSPKEAFDAIRNVRGWWSEEIEGNTAKVGDEFRYHYQDLHTLHHEARGTCARQASRLAG